MNIFILCINLVYARIAVRKSGTLARLVRNMSKESSRLIFAGIFCAALAAGCGGGGGGGGNSGSQPPPAQILPAPADVVAAGGPNSLEVTWSAVDGADFYNLYWSDAPGVTRSTGTKVVNARSPHTISQLAGDRLYYVVVTAQNSAGESRESNEAQAQPDWATPGQVLGVSTEAQPETMSVQWAANPVATGYSVYWSDSPSPGPFGGSNVISDATSPVVISGLLNDVTYYVRVAAFNPAGEGPLSQQVIATPLAAVNGWSAQVLVNQPSSAQVVDAFLGSVDINSNGLAAVAWMTKTSTNSSDTVVSVNHNLNGVWDNEVNLDGDDAALPSVAITPDGNIFVAYDRGTRSIWYRRFDGTTWLPAVQLDSGQPSITKFAPRLSSDGQGNIFAAWGELVGSGIGPENETGQVWIRRFDAGSGEWSDATMISESVRTIRPPIVKANSIGHAVVAWLEDTQPYDQNEDRGGPEQRVAYASYFDGASWEPKTLIGRNNQVGLDTCEEFGVDISESGRAVVVWTQRRDQGMQPATFELDSAQYDPVSGSWDNPLLVSQSDFGDRYVSPHVAIDDSNRSIAAWYPQELNPTMADWVAASIFDTGTGNWGPVNAAVQDQSNNAPGINLSVGRESGGASVVVWAIERPRPRLYVRRSLLGDSNWGQIDTIGALVGRNLRFAHNAGGAAIVATDTILQQNDRLESAIYISVYSP